MRYIIQVRKKGRTRLGIPAVIVAENIDAAIAEFVRQDAGQWLQRGYMIEVTGDDGKKLNYLFSDDGKPKWIPTL